MHDGHYLHVFAPKPVDDAVVVQESFTDVLLVVLGDGGTQVRLLGNRLREANDLLGKHARIHL